MLLGLCGCAALQHRGPRLSDRAVELTATAFYPQRAHQCGPAALATVLDASGVTVAPDDLTASLYIPERHGSLQVELAAAARRHGRLAVEVRGGLPAVVRQLQAGRPVLVLQNLLLTFYPVWHYAVVVGYDPAADRVVLRSGRKRRHLMGSNRFLDTWRSGGNWGLVVLAPEADPRGLDPEAYLQAAADLEGTGAHQAALTAFRSAAGAWPDEPLARLGEANNLYYLGRYREAESSYRALLARDPGQRVAVHNLIMLLLQLHRPCDAEVVMKDAEGLSGALVDAARRALAAADVGSCPGA